MQFTWSAKAKNAGNICRVRNVQKIMYIIVKYKVVVTSPSGSKNISAVNKDNFQ